MVCLMWLKIKLASEEEPLKIKIKSGQVDLKKIELPEWKRK